MSNENDQDESHGQKPHARAEEMTPSVPTPPVFALDSLVGEIEADAATRSAAKDSGRNFGPVTPWPRMTQEFGGAIPNGLHIVMGGSGVGKTAYALQLITGCDAAGLYVSVEMSRLELFRRLVARVTSVFLGKLKDGNVTGPQAATLARRTVAECRRLAIMDATQIPASRAFIERTARAIKERHGSEFVVVVIDSLHSWAESHAGVTEEREAVAAACRELRQLAAVLECPVIAIAETNRASQNRKAGEEQLSAGAGSRKIEFGSETVLYLEGGEEDEVTKTRPVTARFEKNRNGSKGRKVALKFQGAIQTYTCEEGIN